MARPAFAYRTIAEGSEVLSGGESVRWLSDDIRFAYDGSAAPLPEETVLAAFEYASAVWSLPCLAARVSVETKSRSGTIAPGDGVNSIVWIDEGWASQGLDPSSPATTDAQLVQLYDGSWVIEEADIYLNAETFDWAASPGPDVVTTLPVFIHEFGHVLGLAHPCEAEGDKEVPPCSDDSAFEEVVMNPGYSSERLMLSDDDRRGICSLYQDSQAGTGGAGATEEPDGFGGAPSACAENPASEGCTPVNGDFGERCEKATDCQSRLCPMRGDEGMCSSSCTADSDCPQNWSCEQVDFQQLCLPIDIAPNGGCSVSSDREGSNYLSMFVCGVVVIGGCLRRRKCRVSVSRG